MIELKFNPFSPPTKFDQYIEAVSLSTENHVLIEEHKRNVFISYCDMEPVTEEKFTRLLVNVISSQIREQWPMLETTMIVYENRKNWIELLMKSIQISPQFE